jgi:hypothetical protein
MSQESGSSQPNNSVTATTPLLPRDSKSNQQEWSHRDTSGNLVIPGYWDTTCHDTITVPCNKLQNITPLLGLYGRLRVPYDHQIKQHKQYSALLACILVFPTIIAETVSVFEPLFSERDQALIFVITGAVIGVMAGRQQYLENKKISAWEGVTGADKILLQEYGINADQIGMEHFSFIIREISRATGNHAVQMANTGVVVRNGSINASSFMTQISPSTTTTTTTSHTPAVLQPITEEAPPEPPVSNASS